jgi:hypothetical protein
MSEEPNYENMGDREWAKWMNENLSHEQGKRGSYERTFTENLINPATGKWENRRRTEQVKTLKSYPHIERGTNFLIDYKVADDKWESKPMTENLRIKYLKKGTTSWDTDKTMRKIMKEHQDSTNPFKTRLFEEDLTEASSPISSKTPKGEKTLSNIQKGERVIKLAKERLLKIQELINKKRYDRPEQPERREELGRRTRGRKAAPKEIPDTPGRGNALVFLKVAAAHWRSVIRARLTGIDREKRKETGGEEPEYVGKFKEYEEQQIKKATELGQQAQAGGGVGEESGSAEAGGKPTFASKAEHQAAIKKAKTKVSGLKTEYRKKSGWKEEEHGDLEENILGSKFWNFTMGRSGETLYPHDWPDSVIRNYTGAYKSDIKRIAGGVRFGKPQTGTLAAKYREAKAELDELQIPEPAAEPVAEPAAEPAAEPVAEPVEEPTPPTPPKTPSPPTRKKVIKKKPAGEFKGTEEDPRPQFEAVSAGLSQQTDYTAEMLNIVLNVIADGKKNAQPGQEYSYTYGGQTKTKREPCGGGKKFKKGKGCI